jgi:hypothetical protein
MGEGGNDAGLDIDQYGSGDYDPETQTFEFYDIPAEVLAKLTGPVGMTFLPWHRIWAHLDEIEADLHSEFGVDLSSGILRQRTARWLRVHVEQLLTIDSRLRRALQPPPPPQPQAVVEGVAQYV